MFFSFQNSFRSFCGLSLTVLLLAATARAQETRDFSTPLNEKQKITHALNRLTYGPRPGDFERVQTQGLTPWIEKQLHPETIDDRPLNKKLSALSTLSFSPETLLIALDADKGLVQKAKQSEAKKRENPGKVLSASEKLGPQQLQKIERIKEANLPAQTSLQVIGELQRDKLARAVESERQLYEVMVDFWSNHFNLDIRKSDVRVLLVVDEREVIRPHVFSSFRELLGASAKSPAMLIYLDNASSTRALEATPQRPNRRGGINENYARELLELHTLGVDGGYTQQDIQEIARCFTGWSLNRQTGEFFFRARAHDEGEKTVFGQRIPANGGITDGERVLDLVAAHPSTAKFLARKLCQRLVADQPPQSLIDKAAQTFSSTQGDLRATVRTIVTSPEFFSTGAYRAKIKSPLEYSVSAVRALSGTLLMPDTSIPAERAHLLSDGATTLRGNRKRANATFATQIALMGQPLYSFQAPTGYSEDSQGWVSTGALVARLNFALDLVDNKIYDVVASPTQLLKGSSEHSPTALIEPLLSALVGDAASASTRSTLQSEVSQDPAITHKKLTALILGSPEFQRR